MKIKKIHHVAYRCNDAKETAEFYKKILGMNLMLVFAEDKVPSTKENNPYMHIFLNAGMGNILAFFELPNSPKMGRDNNTPEWVQHIAFEIDNLKDLFDIKANAEYMGLEVIGPINHTIFQSIYFHDPNGHRLELAFNTPISKKMMQKAMDLAPEMLDEWDKTKSPPKQNAWLHEDEFKR